MRYLALLIITLLLATTGSGLSADHPRIGLGKAKVAKKARKCGKRYTPNRDAPGRGDEEESESEEESEEETQEQREETEQEEREAAEEGYYTGGGF